MIMHHGPNRTVLTTKRGTGPLMVYGLDEIILTCLDHLPQILAISEGGKYRSDARLAGHGIAWHLG